ncbi:MAG: S-methyl-5'-thioadenosine phosphorylase [Hydrogenobacter thermophilus]|uniref:S-methyl-5'-thioadenosine phosphorylase n=1 Tax=Hydrogenobacter thermophilus TaxID=940 RepID=UPI001C7428E5|nr:S-methyl-5'-thioadenosine phosphorylase [Hydrogenobacter thermophilus]QWK19412.1 MAG: S-methyl-5'-thioadenosine phosphorylase [Hydrogenobacter thermophilus]
MIGIIGGSGLYHLEGAGTVKEVSISTPFGEPSSSILILELDGKKVAFLSRHGKGHIYPPHLVPYRANIWALKELGVSRILSVSAVGGIKESLSPGDYVVISDFIDLTKGRESTFYEGIRSRKVDGDDLVSRLLREGKVVHIDVSEAYCPQMRDVLCAVLERLKLSFHSQGVYACTEGPRFETPSEIKAIKILGGDVVGMTGYPEVVLSRELGMCYSSLCVVTNPAAGVSKHRLTSQEVIELMKRKEEELKKVIAEFVKSLPEERTCQCGKSLEGAQV